MSRLRAGLVSIVALLVAFAACDRQASLGPENAALRASMGTVDGTDVSCKSTGSDLSAVLVNEDVIDKTVNIGDCDVGAYFDEDGVVKNAAFEQPATDPAPDEQFLVRVQGADVDVSGSTFHVNEDYVHEIVHVAYMDGATGDVADNTLTGFKRVGILLTGAGTSATVKGNEVVGVGAKSEGWAENGIQVSGGATGTIKSNDVRDHWWDKNDFLSSGLIIYRSDDVTAQHNDFTGNDASMAFFGDNNNAIGNTVEATAPAGAASDIFHVGALVYAGTDNGLRQNSFSTSSGAVAGIYLTPASTNTKLIRNMFSGNFVEEIIDQGEETKLPDPFEPGE